MTQLAIFRQFFFSPTSAFWIDDAQTPRRLAVAKCKHNTPRKHRRKPLDWLGNKYQQSRIKSLTNIRCIFRTLHRAVLNQSKLRLLCCFECFSNMSSVQNASHAPCNSMQFNAICYPPVSLQMNEALGQILAQAAVRYVPDLQRKDNCFGSIELYV